MTSKRLVNLTLRIRGRRVWLRRALVERVPGGWRVSTMDGQLVCKRSRAVELAWARTYEQRLASVRYAIARNRLLRRLRRLGLPLDGLIVPRIDILEAIVQAAEAGRIAAMDHSPRSESVYIAPIGADTAQTNRGSDGAYRGWLRVAQHPQHVHQQCETVSTADALRVKLGLA